MCICVCVSVGAKTEKKLAIKIAIVSIEEANYALCIFSGYMHTK